MAKYVAKATVWLKIESPFADAVEDAQREVEKLVEIMKDDIPPFITVARATEIEILGGDLVEFETECAKGLTWIDYNNVDHLLDDGIR